jgi:hypothetical protein
MIRLAFPLVLSVLAVSACVTTHAIQLGEPGRYPPVDPDQVQVFLKESDVTVDFERIALIEAEGNYNFADNEDMIAAMRKKAAKLGANALILGEFKDPSLVGKVADHFIGVGGERKGTVIAIRLVPQE